MEMIAATTTCRGGDVVTAGGGVDTLPGVSPAPSSTPVLDHHHDIEKPWLTIVWDDPVNLMRYVTYVFQKIFGYSESRAKELMMQVHNDGKAVVSSGDRAKVEIDVKKLQSFGLWATMQQDS